MSPPPRVIHEHPNAENTLVFTEYQSSSPEHFSLDDDKFVLYGGGLYFDFQVLDRDPNISVSLHEQIVPFTQYPVALFVLNSLFIMWCNEISKGVEFPYQTIVIHALQPGDKLYLQISDNELLHVSNTKSSEFEVTCEVQFVPTTPPKTYPENLQILSRVYNSVESIYQAMSKCSALHFDSESEDQFDTENSSLNQGFQMDIPTNWITKESISLNNTGNADDLEEHENDYEDENEFEDEAGMNVDVGYGPIAGTVRKRNSESNGVKKSRRS